MRDIVKVFKALSDPIRLRMLKLLQGRELCVCKIMQALDISQTRASRNLGILKNAGFVVDRRQGLWVHYSINKDKVNQYHKAISALLDKWLEDEDIIIEDARRLKKAVKLSKVKVCR
ncbi:hypothetical protein AUJ66_08570 [Candidatus Desantisbacteria bacterium CG1_02_38_46]|uniref:Transcriptional regulator n=3 Tax=unclassified Candidatus Desantisiibacteriota TaxID=3106372 RepID=A0A2H9PB31_9BACT|nr:MAG: hypothetical protein AUJ66_08570 [Candidatus Desantisbacteria bacterium CG1_02_38_46]PIU51972.1 MAG: transcriptional regulator [Candidatus Desantisbacteria bacterium CG07_land_8_20_14_0_80_39_15]PIZ15852.1 MAG: transcriptional regulator [Candidatus Desantisbacteria bacterium CG_4_10_14_0_8_um_filter_39_17]